jgi:O-antigen/teichoic acid export membrane protein
MFSFLKSSLSLNTIYNLLGAVLPLFVGAITIPYLIASLGVERFGILTILWSVIGYFSIFDLGIGRAITQQVAAERLISQDSSAIPKLVRTGTEFTFIIGFIAAGIAYFCAHKLAYDWLNVSEGLRAETEMALKFSALGIPLTTMNAGIKGSFEAFELFFISNVARVFLGIMIFLLPVFAIKFFGANLMNVTVSLVIARFLALALLMGFMNRIPMESIWNIRSEFKILKKLFSTGFWMAISNFISPALISADRFIISSLAGAASVAFYTVPFEALTKILIIPGALGAALFPRIAKEYIESESNAKQTFRKISSINKVLLFFGCSFACLVGIPFMRYFVSSDFADKATVITIILAVGVFINGLAYMPYTALHAKGIVRPVAVLHLIEVVIYLPVLYLFVRNWGVNGAGLAWTLRTTFDFFGLYIIKKRFQF